MRTTFLAAALACCASVAPLATAASVEAATVAVIVVEAPLFDPNLSDNNGCDPNGCDASLTRDSDATTLTSRWSCKPSLGPAGSDCVISYTLSDPFVLDNINLALFKGDERTRTIDVLVDGELFTTWTSSGTTTAFETVELGFEGEKIELRGVLGDNEWLSILETEIFVQSDTPTPITTAPPAPAPTPTGGTEQEAGEVGTVTATSGLFDPNPVSSGGCDPAGCDAENTRDGDLSGASRWSCARRLGGDCTISYDLGAVRTITRLRLAMFKGTLRTRSLDVLVDGVFVTTWTSSGTTEDFEDVDFPAASGQVVSIESVGGDSEWLSIVETEIIVLADDGATPPPAAAPTPVPAQPATVEPTTAEPVTVTPSPVDDSEPTGDLEPVGLIPLASTSFERRDRLNTRATFPVKDGDVSTSWTCEAEQVFSGDVPFSCYLNFDLFSYRHLKQVKIALADGASKTTDLSIRVGGFSPLDANLQVFVTNSGNTADLETYDFDFYARFVSIAGVFTSADDTMSIAEVEFVEEVKDGEIRISAFRSSVVGAIGDADFRGPTTDALTFTSDSNEVLDQAISVSLNRYSVVTALELQFPVGDTYLFDLFFYQEGNELTVSNDREPDFTLTGFESTDVTGWQSFDTTADSSIATRVEIIMRGTGSGASGFSLLDARVIGSEVDNPSETYRVASANIGSWSFPEVYPDFVGEGTGDQRAIMGAICAVKGATFDGVDCVGGDEAATGNVVMDFGEYFLDGNIFMKSGVTLTAVDFDDSITYVTLEEGAAGNTETAALFVMDGIVDAQIDRLSISGRYDPESDAGGSAVAGLGSVGVSVDDSEGISLKDTEVRFMDGDAVVVRSSDTVELDAATGPFDEDYGPFEVGSSRGTGIVVDQSGSLFVRHVHVFDNGVAGIQITDSTDVTYVADGGEGIVGSVDGQQPIDIIVEGSARIGFQNMIVESFNDPVMTVTNSTDVSFEDTDFSDVPAGNCVIQTDDLSEVTTLDDPDLILDGTCYVKV